MILRTLLISVAAALFGTAISELYVFVYAKILTMNFSEGASFIRLLAFNIMFCIGLAFLTIVLSKTIKRENVVNFITNFIASGVTLMLVFYQLTMPDPKFTDPSVEGMESFFNTFYIPILFLPAMSWMTFKALQKTK